MNARALRAIALAAALCASDPGRPPDFGCPSCDGRGVQSPVKWGPGWTDCIDCDGSGRWRRPGPNKAGLEYALTISRCNSTPCLIFVGQPATYDVQRAAGGKYPSGWPTVVEVSEYEGDSRQRLVILLVKPKRKLTVYGVATPARLP